MQPRAKSGRCGTAYMQGKAGTVFEALRCLEWMVTRSPGQFEVEFLSDH
jgi:hypothetical protein